MRIVGLMLARNESWVIGCSLRAALRWCDSVLVALHACIDETQRIVSQISKESNRRVAFYSIKDSGQWDEMHVRQRQLEIGRRVMGGTHFAIVDADEILSHNLLDHVRPWFEQLETRQLIDLPMIPAWRSLDQYRDDFSVWSRGWITAGFKDAPDLCWKPKDQNYHHHNRPPQGTLPNRLKPIHHGEGGVFHLQFAAWERLKAKHRHYKMMERLRWPDRETVEQVDRKYSQALDETDIKTSLCPRKWWGDYEKNLVRLSHKSWYEDECVKLWKENGPEPFKGLNLWGFPDAH